MQEAKSYEKSSQPTAQRDIADQFCPHKSSQKNIDLLSHHKKSVRDSGNSVAHCFQILRKKYIY